MHGRRSSGELGRGATGIARAIVNGRSPGPVGIVSGGEVGFDEAVPGLGDPIRFVEDVVVDGLGQDSEKSRCRADFEKKGLNYLQVGGQPADTSIHPHPTPSE